MNAYKSKTALGKDGTLYLAAVSATMTEWQSEADAIAYRDLDAEPIERMSEV